MQLEINSLFHTIFHYKLGSSDEMFKLKFDVLKFAFWSALKPYNIQKVYLKKKLKNEELSKSQIKEVKEKLADIESKMKSVCETPLYDHLYKIRGKIDWLTISSVYMDGFRSPEECEIMWNNVLDFSINKEAFTKDEDEKLLYLAEYYHEREWSLIADLLKTNRTAIQCFQRYQTKFNRNQGGYWTKEEDECLISLFNELKYNGKYSSKVWKLMGTRTHRQCRARYRILSETYKHGPWTPEEDALVIACHDKFGNKWTKMEAFFKRRSRCAIEARCIQSLDPSIKFACPWSIEEDKRFISLIRKHGYGKWTSICKELTGRNRFMCMMRAHYLLRRSIDYHSAQGTKYDRDIYDPELFAKILRPFGASKLSIAACSRISRTFRQDAIDAMAKALRKILPDSGIDNLNLNNFSWLSTKQLHQVSSELHNMFLQREKLNPPRIAPHKHSKKRLFSLRKRYNQENTDDDDSADNTELIPVTHREDKYDELDSVLATLIRMQAINLQPSLKLGPLDVGGREYADMSFYKVFLFKHLGCLAVSNDMEKAMLFGIDYFEELTNVVCYCIQPPLYENIVVAPNSTTICGLEVAGITENRLLSMSKFVYHSKNYMDFIYKRKKSCPKCLQCLYRDNEQGLVENAQNQNEETTLQNMISSMKSEKFIVNEAMEASAYVEVGSNEKCNEVCSCASLQESQKSVQLLRKRFLSLFLWPSLLSITDFTEEQNQILCTRDQTNGVFPKQQSYCYNLKTRVHKKRKRKICESSSSDEEIVEVKKKYNKCKVVLSDELKRSKRACVVGKSLNYADEISESE